MINDQHIPSRSHTALSRVFRCFRDLERAALAEAGHSPAELRYGVQNLSPSLEGACRIDLVVCN